MIQRVESSMKGVFSGRYTAEVADPVILFVIGMWVNRLLALHRWLLPTFNTLRLCIHLKISPPEGYLCGYLYLYWQSIGMMQYWKEFDHWTPLPMIRINPILSLGNS
jgi:hypothetical protein